MSISRIVPPLDYLKEASRSSLQSFELARLNHAANLRREIGTLIDQWIKETSEAMLARWMLDQRATAHEPPLPTPDIFQTIFDIEPAPVPATQTIAAEIVPAPPRFSNSRRPARATMARKAQRQRSSAAS